MRQLWREKAAQVAAEEDTVEQERLLAAADVAAAHVRREAETAAKLVPPLSPLPTPYTLHPTPYSLLPTPCTK